MIGSNIISYQLRDIFSICRCYWNVATYKWKVHNGKIEIITFVVESFLNRSSLSSFMCRSRYESDLAVSMMFFISSSMG